eukprot:m.219335 g.219335  ORF g.219335 m.219335 type:complete len:61 (+) comp17231_c1_seq1:1327-1509(+)
MSTQSVSYHSHSFTVMRLDEPELVLNLALLCNIAVKVKVCPVVNLQMSKAVCALCGGLER